MTDYDFDLFIIGSGSGGGRAGRVAGEYGKKVAYAENRHIGGTCVNLGCVPKKIMTYAAAYASHITDSTGYGWSIGPSAHDWKKYIAAQQGEVEFLNNMIRRGIETDGQTVFNATAKITGPHSVEVGGKTITAERILIATGAKPHIPDLPGAREYGITSDEVFSLPERPQRLVVYGAGYIALEFAGIFNQLGSEVHLVFRRDQILNPDFDGDVRAFLQKEMGKKGVTLHPQTTVTKVEKTPSGLSIGLSDGKTIEADAILFATGRTPNIEPLGLKEIGVELTKDGAVKVDKDDRTNIPSIFAIGDVTGRIALTPVAIAEGHALADRLYGGKPRYISYENIPSAIFSNPPVGQIGLTEERAQEKFPGKIDIYRDDFLSMKNALAQRDERTLVKLIVHRETDKVLGLHMVGQDAPEITQGFAVALIAGATKADFDRTIAIHPTAAEELVLLRGKTR
ncbi:MAG: glutathione-disulfide reductase [Alphaproteobacteria bacterium]|nr:glutathione-disulfide reductase [Alphaproteobacteria bacterium]MBP7758107.1 glutathione-disulfide reductase [Alphaproteobacteria bacterium]MBP7761460.1 glutathione-disulfide reductase [Alphaproteobacteria bacterium]MBP7903805.1 glutathione-disulfide reductase [Alphaproteobacteria bacterium]